MVQFLCFQVALKDTNALLDRSLIEVILKAGPTGRGLKPCPEVSEFLAKLVGVHQRPRLLSSPNSLKMSLFLAGAAPGFVGP
jgi:hypothetical protein